MITITSNFDGTKFYKKFGIDQDAFWVVNDELICPSLPNLTQEDISDCVVDVWQNFREKRGKLLRDSDWTQLPDSPLTNEQKLAWVDYRQALRDIPQNYQNPEEIVYPTPPN